MLEENFDILNRTTDQTNIQGSQHVAQLLCSSYGIVAITGSYEVDWKTTLALLLESQ